MIKFHPSSLGLIMTDAQSVDRALVPTELLEICDKPHKTDKDRELLLPYKEASLSAGAKTYLNRLAKQEVYGYKLQVETKYMDKGLACEQEAIQLLNYLRFKSYVKNIERRESEYLTGECDIYVSGIKTIDTKVAWSLDTFPSVSEDAHDSLYEWQGRAYMKLWEVSEHEVCWLMLDTPEEMIRREQRELHRVNHIPPELRLTSITYARDMALEAKMDDKCAVAMAYLLRRIEQIHAERVPNKVISIGVTMNTMKEVVTQLEQEYKDPAGDTHIVTDSVPGIHAPPDRVPAPPTPPTLRLGQISERLGFTVTADFLAQMGFLCAAMDKNARLFHDRDFPAICAALLQHIETVRGKYQAQALA